MLGVRRGVPLVLLLLPAVALVVGHLLRLTTLPLATFLVFMAIVPFTAWVSYGKDDSNEPVRQMHRYAGYALLPLALSGLVLIAAHLVTGDRYWEPVATLGTELTAEPATGLSALVPGMVLTTVTSLALTIGYYVLFRRYTLLTAALYFGVLLVAAFVVRAFSMTALIVFVCVVLGAVVAPRVQRPVLLVAAVLAVVPYAFAAERAVNWRPPDIEPAASAGPRDHVLAISATGDGARYRFDLRLHPVTGPVHVSGRLVHKGSPVAWCTGHLPAGVSGDVPVACAGPSLPQDVDRIEVSWVVDLQQGRLTGQGSSALRRS